MPDDQAAAKPAEEMIRAARVMESIGFTINPPLGDNQVGEAVIIFRIEDGSKFAITLPVVGLKALRSLVGDVSDAADRAGLASGMVAPKFPADVTVGHSIHMRNCTAIVFNPEKRDEAMYVLPDKIALEVAEAMQRDVYGRMSDRDRRNHMMSKSKIFGAPIKKLILPGGQN